MSWDDLQRLAWQRIDGTITTEDRERLEEAMVADPEARRRFDELCRLSDELALAEQVEPPAELRPRIDRALLNASPSWRRQSAIATLPKRRLLYAAAGLVLGVVVGRLLIPAPPIEGPRATGAMVPLVERSVDALAIELGDGAGTVALSAAGSRWTAEVALHRDAEVELVLSAETGRLEVRSTASQGTVRAEAVEDGDRLVLRSAGIGRTVTTFDSGSDAAALQLVVRSGEQVLVQRTLDGVIPE
jgi:ferric-dicitrate binding protein FerR (iron transport regulator)